ncbi:uncharacterized protein LOC118766060 [Octopus sinensis]|nr:uncharacterized protein LOC118766060 [Octopus sinensis]
MSTLSSTTDCGHGWSVSNAGHYEDLSDLCRYQGDCTWNTRNQLPHTLNRSRGDNNGCNSEPNVDMNTSCCPDQIPLTITGTTSNIIEQPPSVAMAICIPPLPSVPKVTTLPKVP